MIVHLQISKPSPLPCLFSNYRRPWLHKKEPKTFSFSSSRGPISISSAFHTWSTTSACDSMDRHLETETEMQNFIQSPFPNPSTHSLQRSLNVSSKWIVIAVIMAMLVLKHDDEVLWAITGSILNSASSKLLKRIFNQQRPLTALKLKPDPGMPSSHAQSFGFLGLYAAFAVISLKGLNILGVIFASSVLLFCIYLAWLRYVEGLHTRPQVIVGLGFGSFIAAAWILLWRYHVGKLVTAVAMYHYLLVGFFGFSALCFLALGVRKWRIGEA
ncbi:hypothetical protein KP509_07G084300 [Ceratopteris richardii]|uniref:Phosphatidic acid phosphatase type 2/haloperoxidase domain-containing protein n=1 Tax=Ceratopteris richardii TaxID=49495 RepID=A0A8T2UIV0_CERRI|nr:hypothetical protein KP509_07G084300 [Ceratopteris richardii]KAH7433754.1 hypothetical protein KP509_07G084300 [Ceratopteris richardii]